MTKTKIYKVRFKHWKDKLFQDLDIGIILAAKSTKLKMFFALLLFTIITCRHDDVSAKEVHFNFPDRNQGK